MSGDIKLTTTQQTSCVIKILHKKSKKPENLKTYTMKMIPKNYIMLKPKFRSKSKTLTMCTCHISIQSMFNLKLAESKRNHCSKQVRYLNFKCLQRDSKNTNKIYPM